MKISSRVPYSRWAVRPPSAMPGASRQPRAAWSLVLVACWAPGCQTDSPAPADDSFARQVTAEVEASHERYRVAAQSFIDAIARGDTAAAYEKLAPSYTNMVSAESFAARIVKIETSRSRSR